MNLQQQAQQIADAEARYGLPPYYYGRSDYHGAPPLSDHRPPRTLTVEIGTRRFLFSLPVARSDGRFAKPTPPAVAKLLKVSRR